VNSVLKKGCGSSVTAKTKEKLRAHNKLRHNKPRQELKRPKFGPEVNVRKQGSNHYELAEQNVPRAIRLA